MVMHTVPGQMDGVVFHVLAVFEHLHMTYHRNDHENHCHNFGLCTFLQKFFCLVMATCFFFVSHFFAFIVCVRSARDYIGFIYVRYRGE